MPLSPSYWRTNNYLMPIYEELGLFTWARLAMTVRTAFLNRIIGVLSQLYET